MLALLHTNILYLCSHFSNMYRVPHWPGNCFACLVDLLHTVTEYISDDRLSKAVLYDRQLALTLFIVPVYTVVYRLQHHCILHIQFTGSYNDPKGLQVVPQDAPDSSTAALISSSSEVSENQIRLYVLLYAIFYACYYICLQSTSKCIHINRGGCTLFIVALLIHCKKSLRLGL